MITSSSVRPAILLFGDSITQYSFGEIPNTNYGWGSLLSSAYQRRADILNRGFSGYNTRHAIDLVPKIFDDNREGNDNKFLFCTVFFGANDSALPGQRQYVPLEEYGSNLEKIITSIREGCTGTTDEKGATDVNGDRSTASSFSSPTSSSSFPIIVITPPPVDADAWKEWLGLYDEYDRNNDNTRQYGLAAKKVAKQMNCPTLDTWELLGGDREDYGKHLVDGLHLNESGERLVFDGLLNLIKTEYPHLAPQEYKDGEYRGPGIPVEEKIWSDLC